MPFADPSPTGADIHFRLFGFPVRIHPFFWVLALLIGPHEPKKAIIWVASVLVSILVHELGHTFVQRYFGGRPYIVLYSFGGLAFGNGADDSPSSQILISLAGPLAGFALAGLIAAGLALAGHPPQFVAFGQLGFELFDSTIANELLWNLLYINIWWGALNLLPIYPLDGGQVAREVSTLVMPPEKGIVVSLWLSILCAGAAAALCLMGGQIYAVVLFAALAFNNYQSLEAYRQRRRGTW